MMPSLLRYFTVVGGILFTGLIGLNALLEPGGPGPTLVKAEVTKPALRLDPRASKVERLRAEEAAEKAAATNTAAANPVPAPPLAIAAQPAPVAEPAPLPVRPAVAAAASSEPTHTSAPAALTGMPTEDEAERAVRAAQEKMKAEKARKARAKIARERARAREEADSRAQDQIYYGQRPQYAQPQYGHAYAPRPTYGPFGQGGGWGRGW